MLVTGLRLLEFIALALVILTVAACPYQKLHLACKSLKLAGSTARFPLP
jgi:hypothetical protein